MIVAITSILIFTLIVWVIDKKLPIRICAICAGVTLTWLWMFSAIWFGFLPISENEIIIAILMGASIGGIVTEIKKLFLKLRERGVTKNKTSKSSEDKLKNCC